MLFRPTEREGAKVKKINVEPSQDNHSKNLQQLTLIVSLIPPSIRLFISRWSLSSVLTLP